MEERTFSARAGRKAGKFLVFSVCRVDSPRSHARAGSGSAVLQLNEADPGVSCILRVRRSIVAGSRARDALPPCYTPPSPPPRARTMVTFLGRSLPFTSYACVVACPRPRGKGRDLKIRGRGVRALEVGETFFVNGAPHPFGARTLPELKLASCQIFFSLPPPPPQLSLSRCA